MLAVAEINAAGGLLGREIDIVIGDCGATPAEAALETTSMVEIEGVAAIVGMHPSDIRQKVAAVLHGRIPYVFTPEHEGGDPGPGVLAIGDTAARLVTPAIAWLRETAGLSRFFLVGNDYVWPRASMLQARGIVQAAGGEVAGEVFLPYGRADYEPVFDAIRRSRAQVVVLFLLGLENIGFNRAFAAAGLAGGVRRVALATDETVLYAIGPESVEGLLVASGYFSNLRSAANAAFLESYYGCFGDASPPANAFGQSCYEGFHTLVAVANAAGSLAAEAFRGGADGRPSGVCARTARSRGEQGARPLVHLAAADDFEFRVLASY